MNPSYLKLPLLAAGWLLTSGLLPTMAATLVDDTFADGNRTSNPPWYWRTNLSAASRVDTVASNAWTVGNSTGSGNGYILAYFTPTTLALGESITFSFDFSYSMDTSLGNASQFRFGLFNSAGSQVSADGATSDAAFANNTGYAAFYSLQTASAGSVYSLTERSATSNTLWSATAFPSTYTSDPDGADVSAAGNTYQASLTLEYALNGDLILTSLINGQSLTYTDTSPGTLTFDMISMYAAGANGALTFSNIEVSTVPEPGSLGLLAAAGSLGLVLARRKRQLK